MQNLSIVMMVVLIAMYCIHVSHSQCGPIINSGRTAASNWAAVSNPESIAACLRVFPDICALFAILAASVFS